MRPKNKVTFNLSSISTSSRNFVATEARASSGQLWNQSIVQQLTSDGNLRRRVRNASPIGDIARTMCSWSLTRSMNMLKKIFLGFFLFLYWFISNFYYFNSNDGGVAILWVTICDIFLHFEPRMTLKKLDWKIFKI